MKAEELTEMMRLLFFLSHYWEGILDAGLKKDGLTAKQLFLLGIIEKEFSEPPTVSDAAAKTMTSHQNVMQMARSLEKRGFLEIRQDEDDKRIRRLHLTAAHRAFWANRDGGDAAAVEKLFAVLPENDKKSMQKALRLLLPYTAELYERRNEQ